MTSPQLNTFKTIYPMLYAYTTPGVTYHDGWTKIGYTEAQTVEDRIKQQTHTAGLKYEHITLGNALYQDGSYESFTDRDFHAYLQNCKHIEREAGTEWFHIDKQTAKNYFIEFINRECSQDNPKQSDYILRDEQKAAVEMTKAYFEKGGTEFLWNAKPRFGKCLSAYDLVRQMKMTNVLIVTNRPSVANSWLQDFIKFIQWRNEYCFVTENDALKNKGAITRDQYSNFRLKCGTNKPGVIAFESLQGIKGSIYHGGKYNKLEWISRIDWDLLIIDEHTRASIRAKQTSHLKISTPSTPFICRARLSKQSPTANLPQIRFITGLMQTNRPPKKSSIIPAKAIPTSACLAYQCSPISSQI